MIWLFFGSWTKNNKLFLLMEKPFSFSIFLFSHQSFLFLVHQSVKLRKFSFNLSEKIYIFFANHDKLISFYPAIFRRGSYFHLSRWGKNALYFNESRWRVSLKIKISSSFQKLNFSYNFLKNIKIGKLWEIYKWFVEFSSKATSSQLHPLEIFESF
jgi:hypothetical protein